MKFIYCLIIYTQFSLIRPISQEEYIKLISYNRKYVNRSSNVLHSFFDYLYLGYLLNPSEYCVSFHIRDNNIIQYRCEKTCTENQFGNFNVKNTGQDTNTFGSKHCPMGGKILDVSIKVAEAEVKGPYIFY